MVYWILWYMLGLTFIVFSLYLIIPRLFLLTYGRAYLCRDRALGKYNITGGISFLYEPALPIRKYIKKYQLYMTEEEKLYFVGEWERNVAFADYDLIVYNRHNKISKIINVKEKFNSEKCTRHILLPQGTNFVSLKLNKMDDKKFYPKIKTDWLFFVLLFVLSAVIALAVDFLIFITTELLFRGFNLNIVISNAIDWNAMFVYTGLAAALVTIAAGLIWLYVPRRQL